MLTAFEQAKAVLAKATMLVHPRTDAFTAVTVDASTLAIGAVLEQFVRTSWQPLAFFSCQLRPPERKYSAFDRELLALHLAIRHFRYFLEGYEFAAYTDHKPLTFAFGKVLDHWSPQQQQHLTCISEFITNVHHVAGKENHVADALSLCLLNSIHMQIAVDYAAIATVQRTGDKMTAYRAIDTGLILQDVPFGSAGNTLLCDVSTVIHVQLSLQPADVKFLTRYIIYRTQQFGQRVPSSLTSLYGKASASRSAIGPRMCQTAKIHRHVKAPLETFAIPDCRFDHVHIDLVGLLPSLQGFTYLLQ